MIGSNLQKMSLKLGKDDSWSVRIQRLSPEYKSEGWSHTNAVEGAAATHIICIA